MLCWPIVPNSSASLQFFLKEIYSEAFVQSVEREREKCDPRWNKFETTVMIFKNIHSIVFTTVSRTPKNVFHSRQLLSRVLGKCTGKKVADISSKKEKVSVLCLYSPSAEISKILNLPFFARHFSFQINCMKMCACFVVFLKHGFINKRNYICCRCLFLRRCNP